MRGLLRPVPHGQELNGEVVVVSCPGLRKPSSDVNIKARSLADRVPARHIADNTAAFAASNHSAWRLATFSNSLPACSEWRVVMTETPAVEGAVADNATDPRGRKCRTWNYRGQGRFRLGRTHCKPAPRGHAHGGLTVKAHAVHRNTSNTNRSVRLGTRTGAMSPPPGPSREWDAQEKEVCSLLLKGERTARCLHAAVGSKCGTAAAGGCLGVARALPRFHGGPHPRSVLGPR